MELLYDPSEALNELADQHVGANFVRVASLYLSSQQRCRFVQIESPK